MIISTISINSRGDNYARAVKGSVQRSVRIVTDNRKASAAYTGDDNLTVRLNRHRPSSVKNIWSIAIISDSYSAVAEGRVEVARRG